MYMYTILAFRVEGAGGHFVVKLMESIIYFLQSMVGMGRSQPYGSSNNIVFVRGE